MLLPATNPFLASAGLLATAIILTVIVRNGWMKRRLRLTAFLAAVAVALHLVRSSGSLTLSTEQLAAIEVIEHLLLALAVIHGLVTLLLNPWFREGAPERAPGIVQNALVLGAFGVLATLVFPGQLLATSAVGAVIMGFAVQETLSNFFAGLALQIDRPFRAGHWIEVGPFQGRVKEVTWRATKIQTKAGNLVIVPNNIVGKEAINNYSEPSAPTMLTVDVGVGYQHPPNVVREALLSAVRRCPSVLKSPETLVVMTDFGSSALIFQIRYWVDDFSRDFESRDEVRTAIYYELNRRQIEIPWPIQIEYSREEQPRDTPARREAFAKQIAAIPVLAPLPAEGQEAIARAACERLFARGERIVTEGDAGASMFVVLEGSVAITVGKDAREVAVTTAGGYFGEMSLLTGDARSATVTAREDTTVLELSASAFGDFIRSQPAVLEGIAQAAVGRRQELETVRQTPDAVPVPQATTLLERMKRFFRVG